MKTAIVPSSLLSIAIVLITSSVVVNSFQQPPHLGLTFTTSSLLRRSDVRPLVRKKQWTLPLPSIHLHATLQQDDHDDETNDPIPKKQFTILERVFDTMTPAGFDTLPKFAISGKRFLLIAAGLMFWKWYRAKFLLKQKFTEKQPAWGHVITSKEQEKALHAWTCRNCGTTMFIAKGREFRFFNRWVECYNCGARGKDSFYDRREEIAEKDDTDFRYENPNDYLTKSELKKKLKMEEKGGGVKEEGVVVTTTAVKVEEKEDRMNGEGTMGKEKEKKGGSKDFMDELDMDP